MTQQHLDLGDCKTILTTDGKRCQECGIMKPLSSYGRDVYRGDNLGRRCRRCLKIRGQLHQQYRHKLVQQFYERQNGLCPICNEPLDLDKAPALDHPHSAEAMRNVHTLAAATTGLLHSTCNRALGMLNDDPLALRRAARYLEQTRCYGQLTLDL
jgi:hypothetical protein